MKVLGFDSDAFVLIDAVGAPVRSRIERGADGVPTAIELLRPGLLTLTRDGEAVSANVSAEDIRAILDYHAAKGELIPLDCEHLIQQLADRMGTEEGELLKSQKLLGENAAAGMAALVERDGSIWARIDKWAARARELLAGSGDAMYGYFSPVIRGLKNGPLRITSIALTNTPAINGQDLLAASDRGAVIPLTFSEKHQPNPKEKSMKKLLSRLAQLLGHDVAALTDTTDPSTLIEGACGAIETLRAGVVDLADVRGALALADDAKPPAIVGAALAAIERGKADAAALTEAQTRLKGFEAAHKAALIDRLTAEGKLTAAMRPWAEKQDVAALTDFAAAAPVLVPQGTLAGKSSVGVESDALALTDTDRQVAAACGLTLEQYAKANGLKL
jgi:phage I-like protein